MSNAVIKIGINSLLGGIWGLLLALLITKFVPYDLIISALYYPLLFIGLFVIIAFYFDLDISISRLLFVGIISGFEYSYLSNHLQLLSCILLSLIIGFGFKENKQRVYKSVFNTIKGVIIIPLGIFMGSSMNFLLYNYSGYSYVYWYFWAALIMVVFILTLVPAEALKEDNNHEILETNSHDSSVSKLKSEIKNILNDLESIKIHI